MADIIVMRQDAHALPIADPVAQKFDCAVCGNTGTETFPGADSWASDDGVILLSAQMTAVNAWVCGRRCLSQLMYLAGTPDEREALIRLRVALGAIAEAVPLLATLITAWSPEPLEKIDNVLFALKQTAGVTAALVAVSLGPDWASAPSREEILDCEMRAIQLITSSPAPEMQAIRKRATAALAEVAR